MTSCSRHQCTTPRTPARPFVAKYSPYLCKGCGSQEGTDADRLAHHCPCCGEHVAGTCMVRPGAAECPQCGLIDAATREFCAPVDHLVELLEGRRMPNDNYRSWQLARDQFGEDVAYHLALGSETTRDYLTWNLVVQRDRLALRWIRAQQQFEAAAPCPHPDCRRGQVWNSVRTRQDLLGIHRGGPRPGHSRCRSCEHAGR